MELCIILKINRQKETGRPLYVCKVANKTVILTGNLPNFPSGTGLRIDYTLYPNTLKGYIEDYEYSLSERNRQLLEKQGIDVDKFYADVLLHKKIARLPWEDLEKVKGNPYKYFVFQKADMYHKQTVDNSTEMNRMEALVQEFVKHNRKYRREECTLNEYLLAVKGIQERDSAYPILSESASLYALNNNESVHISQSGLQDVEIKDARKFVHLDIKSRNVTIEKMYSEDEILPYLSDRLSDEQKECVVKSLADKRPVCITGGAGTGKTTVINEILRAYIGIKGMDDVLLIAPTGKASRRMAVVTNHEAKTIHSAIRKTVEDEIAWKNKWNPLEEELIIVDESSMIDMLLMSDLLHAIKSGAKIIFVGDYNQLYPVGVGEPYHEFIREEMCGVFTLTKNFRQSDENDILNTAMAILDGKLRIESGKNLSVQTIRKDEILKYIPKMDEVQVISPYNSINEIINNYLKKGEGRFNVGDKVIFLKNTEDYCNGDTGKVVSLAGNGVTVKLDDISRIITVRGDELEDLMLAYSLTVHKVQGSEYADVVLFLPEKENRFIEKRMLYTAVTRARESLCVYYYEE